MTLNKPLALVPDAGAPVEHALSDDEVERMATARSWSKSRQTLRCYAGDWRAFAAYARIHGRTAFPATAEAIEAYVTFLAAAKVPARELEAWQRACAVPGPAGRPSRRAAPPYPPSSVDRALAGIRYVHGLLAHKAGDTRDPFADLRLREALRGIRRRHAAGEARPKGARALHHEVKAGIDRDLLLELLATIDTTSVYGLRDKALLCAGYVGAMRISELAALSWGEISEGRDGYSIKLARSKSNQDGRRVDDVVLLPRLDNAACPVKAIQTWRAAAGLVKRGFVFSRISQTKNARGEPTGYVAHKADGGGGTGLSSATIASMVGRIIAAAKASAPPGSKLQELDVNDFAGHSLRRGMTTALAESGGAIDEIQATLRHRSVQTTMGYVHTRNPRRVGAVRKAMDESVKLNASSKRRTGMLKDVDSN